MYVISLIIHFPLIMSFMIFYEKLRNFFYTNKAILILCENTCDN